MDLTHRFSVPAPLDEAWRVFNELEGLAPCFPGATVSSVEGDEFAGSVKVKLGPIALLYTGSGRYVERNDAERRVVIEARGKDKRGNGTATATVTASFTGSGEQTDVEVLTDLAITGKPAQFGRGVISDVSDKLLDQFVRCVSERFAAGGAEHQPGAEAAEAAPVQPVSEEPVSEEPVSKEPEPKPAGPSAPQASAPPTGARPTGARPAPAPPAPAPPTEAASADAQAGGEPEAASPPKPQVAPARPISPEHAATTQEGLNLLGTVVPVLLKRYGPVLAAVGLLLFVLIKIIRRRS